MIKYIYLKTSIIRVRININEILSNFDNIYLGINI